MHVDDLLKLDKSIWFKKIRSRCKVKYLPSPNSNDGIFPPS